MSGKDLRLNPRHVERQADTNHEMYYFVHLNVKGIFPSLLLYHLAKRVRVCKIALFPLTSASSSKKPRKLLGFFWHKMHTVPLLYYSSLNYMLSLFLTALSSLLFLLHGLYRIACSAQGIVCIDKGVALRRYKADPKLHAEIRVNPLDFSILLPFYSVVK